MTWRATPARLYPADRAVLGQVGRAFRAMVERGAGVKMSPPLPCAGKSAGVPLKLVDFVGSVARLAWAKANGCPWGDERTSALAAHGGHPEVLQWAWEHDAPRGDGIYTSVRAATAGNLAVLQWAHENGCSWHEATCDAAARSGHLAVLQYAREHGCPW